MLTESNSLAENPIETEIQSPAEEICICLDPLAKLARQRRSPVIQTITRTRKPLLWYAAKRQLVCTVRNMTNHCACM